MAELAPVGNGEHQLEIRNSDLEKPELGSQNLAGGQANAWAPFPRPVTPEFELIVELERTCVLRAHSLVLRRENVPLAPPNGLAVLYSSDEAGPREGGELGRLFELRRIRFRYDAG